MDNQITETDILARPAEFRRRYENVQAQLAVREQTISQLERALGAVTAERDAAAANFLYASKEWQTTGDERDATFIVASLQQNRADKAEAERDAARAEVARLTAALESVRGDVANNERHLDIVEYINAALRGDTAPAQVLTAGAERTIEWEE